jgi:hypothetical protein
VLPWCRPKSQPVWNQNETRSGARQTPLGACQEGAELEDNKDRLSGCIMSSRQILLLVTLLLCASELGAQVTLTAQNITVQVTTAQPWTDSGLDLAA